MTLLPKMNVKLSFDDNCYENYRLATLLELYDLPATFYLPVGDIDWDFAKMLRSKGFEIGSHTMTHPQDIKLLTKKKKEYEIRESKDQLEANLNREITKICWTRGRYDKECEDIAISAGYEEGRSTLVGYTEENEGFTKHTTVHVYQRDEYQNTSWFDYANLLLDTKPQMFSLWSHGWELQKFDYWDDFGLLIKRLSKL